jgi:hypothetical protein
MTDGGSRAPRRAGPENLTLGWDGQQSAAPLRKTGKTERPVTIDLPRHSFLRVAGAGVAATSLGAMGFGAAEAAHVRAFKLTSTTEACDICT